jgi:hypothetical protein
MNLSIDRRQLLLASMALGASGGARAQPAASPNVAPHPDLALKLMIVGRRRPGTTLAEHRHHIRRVHGELVVQNIAADPANAPRRYVQNPVFDGIDEFWFDDEAGARAFLRRWQAWVSEALVRPGLAPEGRHFVLLAHEDVIHAGPR